jgi:uncharacterized membrane protein YqhA
MAQAQQVHRLRPVPAMIFAARSQLEVKVMMWQTIIHLTFLVSAIAIAAADRVLGIRYHDDHMARAEA